MSSFIEDLMASMDLRAEDLGGLRALHPLLKPRFRDFADQFYASILRSPSAAAVFSGPAQVERLKQTLGEWMSSGLLGPHDDRFYEKRSRIGRRHVQIGLAQQYMFTAMNVVRTGYLEAIAELVPAAEVAAYMRAANKLLDLELALMLRHYQLDSEERLVARERRIEADRLLGMQSLTAGLAHEVRNPLNAAKLQLELLERRLRRLGDDPKLIEPSQLAHYEIERLTRLLNEFLSFARPPSLHAQIRDVVPIVQQVLEVERPLADRRHVTLTLAETVEPLQAEVDPGKLHQIVQNLLRNAIEAVGEGGEVDVAVTGDADLISILIHDDGPGVPPEVQARIYEPFFSTKEAGTGMGMAIVHSLVTLHGGKIELSSTPGSTTFTVSLPHRVG
jgi:signal transduction histidine kinase